MAAPNGDRGAQRLFTTWPECAKGIRSAQLDYPVLGRIDLSLAFMRLQLPYANEPVLHMRTKMNAERTLAELQQLQMPSHIPASAQLANPQPILSQFIEMQMGGMGLRSSGPNRLDMFFAHPPTWSADKLRIARGYRVAGWRDADIRGDI